MKKVKHSDLDYLLSAWSIGLENLISNQPDAEEFDKKKPIYKVKEFIEGLRLLEETTGKLIYFLEENEVGGVLHVDFSTAGKSGFLPKFY
jgi:hypothetical protein